MVQPKIPNIHFKEGKIDRNLEKLIKKASLINNVLDEAIPYEIIEQIRDGRDCLLTMHDGTERMSLILDVVRELISAGEHLWYVFPPESLSFFRVSWLEGSIGHDFSSIRCPWRMDDTNKNVIIWSWDVLHDNLLEVLSGGEEKMPALLIVDSFEYLGEQNIGPQLEELLLRLPHGISLLVAMSSAGNTQEIITWIKKIRNRLCHLINTEVQGHESILAFLTPEWNLIPLLNKKRVSNKVKKLLKETKPISRIDSPKFIQPLLSLLRKEKMTPALIFMPSAQDCNEAVRNSPHVNEGVGEVITSPQILAFFDRYPILKDTEDVVSVLRKGAGSFHSDHHPAWCEMMELFLSFNHIDIAFTTIGSAQSFMTSVNSVVLTTSRVSTVEDEKLRPMSGKELYQIRKLLMSRKGEGSGAIIIANTPYVDILHFKDLHMARPNIISSLFHCSFQAVLGLVSMEKSTPHEAMDDTLFSFQKQPEDTSRLNEILIELRDEIPESACKSPRAAIKLISIYNKLKIHLDKATFTIKKSKKKTERELSERKIAAIKLQISHLPCRTCIHQDNCQKMKYRKIRALVNEYDDLRRRFNKSSSALPLGLNDFIDPLTELGFIDKNLAPTNKGFLALRTGLQFPQLLVECVEKRVIPLNNSALSSAIVAGFVECPENEQPRQVDDFVKQPLLNAYNNIDMVVSPAQDQLLRLGHITFGPAWKRKQALIPLPRRRASL